MQLFRSDSFIHQIQKIFVDHDAGALQEEHDFVVAASYPLPLSGVISCGLPCGTSGRAVGLQPIGDKGHYHILIEQSKTARSGAAGAVVGWRSAAGAVGARLGELRLYSQPRQGADPEREGLRCREGELHGEHSHGAGGKREGQRCSEKELLHDDPP
jgi:hypothetical protein